MQKRRSYQDLQDLVKRSSNSTSKDYLYELVVDRDWMNRECAMDMAIDDFVMEFSRFQSLREGHWWLLWWMKIWWSVGLMRATPLEICGRIIGRDA